MSGSSLVRIGSLCNTGYGRLDLAVTAVFGARERTNFRGLPTSPRHYHPTFGNRSDRPHGPDRPVAGPAVWAAATDLRPAPQPSVYRPCPGRLRRWGGEHQEGNLPARVVPGPPRRTRRARRRRRRDAMRPSRVPRDPRRRPGHQRPALSSPEMLPRQVCRSSRACRWPAGVDRPGALDRRARAERGCGRAARCPSGKRVASDPLDSSHDHPPPRDEPGPAARRPRDRAELVIAERRVSWTG